MTLKIYNTLSKTKKRFRSLNKNKINLFVCGPTVYDHAHIGHARCFIFFDFFVKYLRSKGLEVFYLQNITDIAKKINRKAIENKKTPKEVSAFYTKSFLEDMASLNITSVTKYAITTKYLNEIKSQIKRLIEKGYGYITKEGVLFNTKKVRRFGMLIKKNKRKSLKDIEPGYSKKNIKDFFLWRNNLDSYLLSWNSPWGKGIPGWHIEDTAITEKYFGSQYDIHGGGIDLIYPHHEAERAQMESITKKRPFVNYWMHIQILKIKGKKMSKSKGNCIYIKNILKKYSHNTIRIFSLSKHYRKKLNYSKREIKKAKLINELLLKVIKNLRKISKNKKSKTENKRKKIFIKEICSILEDDLNTELVIKKFNNYLLKIRKDIKKKKVSRQDAELYLEEISNLSNIFGLTI